ncbi:MAG: hypothetical protein ACYCWW_14140 [Deltaproteobacteria bacterium]
MKARGLGLTAAHLLAMAALAASACGGGGSGGGDGGADAASPAFEGELCSGAAGCISGLGCETYTGVGAGAGQTIAICRQTCAQATDCNVTFPSDVCTNGYFTCTPTNDPSTDPCTKVNPNTVCHPDYQYCVTVGGGSCQPGEAPATYEGQTICRPAPADAGVTTDGGPQGACSGTDVQSSCSWPEFCTGTDCAAPQNVSATGQDSPSPSCAFTGSGGGNADQIRATPVASNGPILMAMAQDLTQADCSNAQLKTDMTADTNSQHLCNGDGNEQCGSTEFAVMFQGSVYDPAGAFVTAEGPSLDGQFYRIVEGGSTQGAGDDLTQAASGAVHAGHVIPQGDWTAHGGSFVLLRCFGAGNTTLTQGYTPAHYAQTTGNPGNTFCATWQS